MAGYLGNNPADSSVRIARQIYTTSGITSDFTFTSGYDAGYIDIYVNGERQTEGTNFTASDGSTFTILNGGVSTGSTVEAAAYKSFNVATVTLGEVTDVDDLTISGALNAGSTVVGSAVTSNLSGINVSGVVTATTFSGGTFTGDGSALTGLASTDIINAEQVNVSGSTTTGIATVSTSIVVGSAVTVTATAININPTVTTTIGDSGNVDFNDDAKARFGTGNDLSIYHSGSHSFINDSGTGNLKILSSQVDILNPASNETIATFAENGAVSIYYDNSKKLETTGYGAALTDNDASAELRFTTTTGQVGSLWGNSDTTFGLLDGQGHSSVICTKDGSVDLYYDNVRKFRTVSDGCEINAAEGGEAILALISDEGDDNADYWRINNSNDGILAIEDYSGGSWATRFRVKQDGKVQIPNDTGKYECGSSGDLSLYHDGSHSHLVNNTGNLRILAGGAGSLVLTAKDGEEAITCATDGAVILKYDNTSRLTTTSTGVTIAGTVSDSLGNLRSIPYSGNSGAYTLVASDAGKVVGADTSWTIPASTFSAGDAVTLLNLGGSDLSLTASALTYLWNTADAANVKASTLTLGGRSMATIYFKTANEAFIQASKLNVS